MGYATTFIHLVVFHPNHIIHAHIGTNMYHVSWQHHTNIWRVSFDLLFCAIDRLPSWLQLDKLPNGFKRNTEVCYMLLLFMQRKEVFIFYFFLSRFFWTPFCSSILASFGHNISILSRCCVISYVCLCTLACYFHTQPSISISPFFFFFLFLLSCF